MKKYLLFILFSLLYSLPTSAQEYYQSVLKDSVTNSSDFYVDTTDTRVSKPFNIYEFTTFHYFGQDTSSGTDTLKVRLELWQTTELSTGASWVRTLVLDDSLSAGTTDFNSNFYGAITKSFSNYAAMPFAKIKLVGLSTNSGTSPNLFRINTSSARGR